MFLTRLRPLTRICRAPRGPAGSRLIGTSAPRLKQQKEEDDLMTEEEIQKMFDEEMGKDSDSSEGVEYVDPLVAELPPPIIRHFAQNPPRVDTPPEPWHPSHLRDVSKLPRRIQSFDELGENFTEEEYAAALVHGRSVQEPFYHLRTADIPVAMLHFRSHHPRLLDLFVHFASHAASSLAIPISRPISLPSRRQLWTVLRSPFIYKKSQENFERRTWKRAIKAWDAHPEVVDRWIQFLRKHELAGVGMRVTRWHRAPLGLGQVPAAEGTDTQRKALEQTRPVEVKRRIEALGEKIVKEELRIPSS